jgi:transposase-like protein
MKRKCPNPHCPNYQKTESIIKNGSFYRKSDSRFIKRFKCTQCGKRFSTETNKLEKFQKKRRINHQVYKLLSSSVSIRRTAKLLKVNQKTVARRVRYLGEKYRLLNKKQKKNYHKTEVLLIDDLITKENTKLKPLSVSIAVDEEKRVILGAQVSVIPSFGHLAQKSRLRYGFRKCEHLKGLDSLFDSIKDNVAPEAVIKSDEHKKYPKVISKYFPNSNHEQFPSERACVAGQGELKKVHHDPLFMINHTCAMMRANINRLVRKTWCTTKDPARLSDHIEIFIHYFNNEILKSPRPFIGSS